MRGLKQKIGQMIMIGLQREELTAEEKKLLKNFCFGGFILFSHNLKEAEQIRSLCQSLWEISKDAPPLIAIDQEGGRVHRLPPPFTHFPPAAVLGRTGNTGLAYKAGLATARELSAVGINLNFAPVLDVHSNPSNPVIGDRALSSDPEQVAQLGWSIIQGLRAGGVIPCAKHFPGHGDTDKDSHLELPVVRKDRASLDALELIPFARVCEKEIESIMTAHVLYPALDGKYPATLSRSVVSGLLRKKFQYAGVVFGDDLEMRAISRHYSVEETLALGLEADLDVFMFCHQKESAIKTCESLTSQAEKDDGVRARIDESYRRILSLKERYLKKFTGSDKRLEDTVDLFQHRRLVEEIQASS